MTFATGDSSSTKLHNIPDEITDISLAEDNVQPWWSMSFFEANESGPSDSEESKDYTQSPLSTDELSSICKLPFTYPQSSSDIPTNVLKCDLDQASTQHCAFDTKQVSLSTKRNSKPKSSLPSDPVRQLNVYSTDRGFRVQVNLSNITEFQSFVADICRMCDSPSTQYPVPPSKPNKWEHVVIPRNPSFRSTPVNFFDYANYLGRERANQAYAIQSSELVDQCIYVYFHCWIRYLPVLNGNEFIKWYKSHPSPTDTLIVNAICAYAFRHMIVHHPKRPEWKEDFLSRPDMIKDQEEFFFRRARECLENLLCDIPDRYTVVALALMSTRAEPARRHHYLCMAVSCMYALDIYPRLVPSNGKKNSVTIHANDSYRLEMDTRLWWFIWAIDFYLYSQGGPKNTPQVRNHGQVPDLPCTMNQDIVACDAGVLSYCYCLRLWVIQADFIDKIYEQDEEHTLDQLKDFDRLLDDYYEALPEPLRFRGGYNYTNREHLSQVCLRVTIEWHATRIILHKPFLPTLNNTEPNTHHLVSLNLCLKAALSQLDVFEESQYGATVCILDCKEIQRAAEIISLSMDMYFTIQSLTHFHIMLKNIELDSFRSSLQKALAIVKGTAEYNAKDKNWIRVAQCIEKEIQRLGSRTLSFIPSSFPVPRQPPAGSQNDARPGRHFRYFNPLKRDIMFITENPST